MLYLRHIFKIKRMSYFDWFALRISFFFCFTNVNNKNYVTVNITVMFNIICILPFSNHKLIYFEIKCIDWNPVTWYDSMFFIINMHATKIHVIILNILKTANNCTSSWNIGWKIRNKNNYFSLYFVTSKHV